jgi:hypothetical protein
MRHGAAHIALSVTNGLGISGLSQRTAIECDGGALDA